MEPIHSHDALFRFVFGDPETVADLLRASVPAELASALDWPTLRRLDGSFVDADLRQPRADLLLHVRGAAGGDALLYVVCEHKSHRDPLTAWQVTRYVVRVVEQWLAEHSGTSEIPAVLPFVVHHGPLPWRDARSPDELVGWRHWSAAAVRHLRPSQVQMQIHLLDLAAMSEEDVEALRLSASADMALRFLQFLRDAPPSRVAERITRWRLLFERLLDERRGREVLAALFSWYFAVAPENVETLRTVMAKLDEDKPMRSCLDLLLEMNEQRGLEKGMQQGLAAMRALVREQLEARFGAVPPEVVAQLAEAGAETLHGIGRRVLTAASLDEALAPAG